MKPRNFPARRLARQFAADIRLMDGSPAVTAAQIYQEDTGRGGVLDQARQRRSKKQRAG